MTIEDLKHAHDSIPPTDAMARARRKEIIRQILKLKKEKEQSERKE